MRIKFTFSSERMIELPYTYPQYIRALIYKLLPEKFAQQLHDEGYKYEKRTFKLFTFSRLMGNRINSKNKALLPLRFKNKVSFYLGSPKNDLLEYFTTAAIQRETLKLGANDIFISSVEVIKSPVFNDKVNIKMLSPLTIRSTLSTADGRKKSYFYSPHEKEFSQLMLKNMQKKYQVVYGKEIDGALEIMPTGHNRERIITADKGFIIRAWDGNYELRGTPELIQLSYATGLGEKNSAGFGMWREEI